MKDAKGLFLMLVGAALFILIIGLVTKTSSGENTILSPYLHIPQFGKTATPAPTGLANLKPISLGKTTVMVEVANTESTRSQGLSGVSGMPEGQGMLFDFGVKNISPINARFWMKDMKFALDFIWIQAGRVVEITPNIPAPLTGTADKDLAVYQPNENIDYVLEVNAGFAARHNIKIGDAFTGL